MGNDKRILALREEIKKKKEDLGNPVRFEPITHCHLFLGGQNYNLHVLNLDTIVSVFVELNALYRSAKELGLDESYSINNFLIKDWFADIKLKHESLKQEEEAKKIKELDEKLSNLLSEEKKTELSIDEIASELNL